MAGTRPAMAEEQRTWRQFLLQPPSSLDTNGAKPDAAWSVRRRAQIVAARGCSPGQHACQYVVMQDVMMKQGVVACPIITCQGTCGGGQGCQLVHSCSLSSLEWALPCVDTPGGLKRRLRRSIADARPVADARQSAVPPTS